MAQAEQSFLFDVKERDKKLLQKLRTSRTARTTVNNKLSMAIKKAEAYFPESEYDKYELVTTEARLMEIVDICIADKVFGLDTESSVAGKKPDPIDDDMVGFSLYSESMEKEAYFPTGHFYTDDNLSLDAVTRAMEKLSKADAVFHNAKYDIRVIKNFCGVWMNIHWDTYLGSCYLNEEEPHGLKPLWDKYIQEGEDKSKTFADLFSGIDFGLVPLNLAKCYAAKDARMTYELYKFQYPYLDGESTQCSKAGLVEASNFLRNVEIPLLRIVADIEEEGVHIDADFADELKEKYERIQDEIKTDLQDFINTLDLQSLPPARLQKLGDPVNFNSPTQLGIILYEVLGLDTGSHKAGSTSEAVLKYLIESTKNEDIANFIQRILDFREVNKLLSTYIYTLPEMVKEKTGKLHASFNQFGAKTGRFSSSNPNLQNIPSKNKEVRKLFIPPEGEVLICADYSQQEPRVLTFMCRDQNLIDTYKSGKDLYSMMSSIIFKKPYEESLEYFPDGSPNPDGKKRRSRMKTIILGLMYGMGASAMSEQLGMDVEEAKAFIDMFFERFPSIREFIDSSRYEAYEKGYVTTVYGRKRRLLNLRLPEFEFYYFNTGKEVPPEVAKYFSTRMNGKWKSDKDEIKEEARNMGIRCIDNGGKIADAERQIVNSIIQGTSADCTKLAMLAIGRDERLKEIGFKLLMSVHDEVIGSVPREHMKECADILNRLMVSACADEIDVPMKVDVTCHPRWYGEELEY